MQLKERQSKNLASVNRSTKAGHDFSRLLKGGIRPKTRNETTDGSIALLVQPLNVYPWVLPHSRPLPDSQATDRLSPRSGGHDTRYGRHNLQLRSGWCHFNVNEIAGSHLSVTGSFGRKGPFSSSANGITLSRAGRNLPRGKNGYNVVVVAAGRVDANNRRR